ncbi:hypothetical protein Acor_02530 [Acrocarpospora corrugata]|uniref:Uncharacterized protein n=1 Tax=Acrocarpospora corrugata TaxID=35763 RepID=A0A5M3VRG3_9ACTN|nr:hypothetical protein Acor_02530 [Acrocarpospora corrugata]
MGVTNIDGPGTRPSRAVHRQIRGILTPPRGSHPASPPAIGTRDRTPGRFLCRRDSALL